jgi:uncharacterized membrane protein YqhA
MFRQLLKLRYIAVAIVVIAVLHAVAFLFLGAQIAVRGYWRITHGLTPDNGGPPGVELLHSLDYLFVSLVLLVLALGIAKLFLLSPSARDDELPVWLRIASITELKVLLWETILTTLLVLALSDLSATVVSTPDSTMLLMPAAILLLAVSLYFMKKA